MSFLRALVLVIALLLPAQAFHSQGMPIAEYQKNNDDWFDTSEASNMAAKQLFFRRGFKPEEYLDYDQVAYLARFGRLRKKQRFLDEALFDLNFVTEFENLKLCPDKALQFLLRLRQSDELEFLLKDSQKIAETNLTKLIDYILSVQFEYQGQHTGWAEPVGPHSNYISVKQTTNLLELLEQVKPSTKELEQRISVAKQWLAEVNQVGKLWDPYARKLINDSTKFHLWANYYDPTTNKPIAVSEQDQTYGTWACKFFECNDLPNILFVVIDDLNDRIKLLKPDVLTQTPHLEEFAKRASLFTEAYTSASQCNPSRYSVLTGLNPHQTEVYNNSDDTRKQAKEQKFLMEEFKNYGYQTIGLNKIFHGTQNIARVWDQYYDYRGPDSSNVYSPVIQSSDDDNFDNNGDGKAAAKAQEILSNKFKQPTFMAIGFYSPHPPWNFAEKYFDIYPLEKIEVPKQPSYDLYDVPEAGKVLAHKGLMGPWEAYHEKILDAGEWKHALQAYMAGASRVDAEFGKVINALYDGPNAKNTIVIVWSDHGFHLGEKQHWKKHALWQSTTHVPFLISKPGQQQAQRIDKVVSLLDIYPTLVDMLGLATRPDLAGNSLLPLINNPQLTWEEAALTTMLEGNYSIRKGRWRYTRYADGSEELYDREFDPNEFYNLVHLQQLNKIKQDLASLIPGA